MKGKDKFEYGGLWIHATPKYAEKWRVKGEYLYPPPEAFHMYLIIMRQLR